MDKPELPTSARFDLNALGRLLPDAGYVCIACSLSSFFDGLPIGRGGLSRSACGEAKEGLTAMLSVRDGGEMTKRFGQIEVPDFDVEAVTREVQAAFAPYRSKNGTVVDELIALRRIDAWQETLEAIRGFDPD